MIVADLLTRLVMAGVLLAGTPFGVWLVLDILKPTDAGEDEEVR